MDRRTTIRGTICRLTCGAILILCAIGLLARVAIYADGGGGGGGTLQIIATPFGNNTNATGISADGSVILGEYFLPSNDPQCQTFGGCTRTFRWTTASGAQDIRPIDDSTGEVQAHAINSNGTQIVGESISALAFGLTFIWQTSTSTRDIATPIELRVPDLISARDFVKSAAGSIISGDAAPPQPSPQPNLITRAFRFTTAGVFEFLAPLPNEIQSQGTAVSADGTTIVGISYDTNTFLPRAFRWRAGVEQNLGTLGGSQAWATSTSADGSVVVGASDTANCRNGCPHAFRWTAAGMQDLGDLGGGSYGQGVSADGSVVVGSAPAAPPGGLTRAFR